MVIPAALNSVPLTYKIVAILAATAFFLPLLLVLLRRMGSYRPFVWLTAYWAVSGIVNLILVGEKIAGSNVTVVIERVYNLAGAPLMLLILYKSVQIEKIQNSIKKVLPAFLCAVLAVTLITRLQYYAEVLMVGAGLVIVLIYILWVIAHYLKGIKLHNEDQALQFIYYALLFEYGISVITFVFNYIIPHHRDIADSFLIYHLSIIVSTLIASYGLLSYRPRSAKQKAGQKKRIMEREAEIRFL